MGGEDYDDPCDPRGVYGPWEHTPRWHPARWFGFDMRRYQNYEPWDRGWCYERSGVLARRLLSSEYEPKEARASSILFE